MRAGLALKYGWSFSVIDEMTLDDIDSAWNEGKRSKGIPVESMSDIASAARNWRRYYAGLC